MKSFSFVTVIFSSWFNARRGWVLGSTVCTHGWILSCTSALGTNFSKPRDGHRMSKMRAFQVPSNRCMTLWSCRRRNWGVGVRFSDKWPVKTETVSTLPCWRVGWRYLTVLSKKVWVFGRSALSGFPLCFRNSHECCPCASYNKAENIFRRSCEGAFTQHQTRWYRQCLQHTLVVATKEEHSQLIFTHLAILSLKHHIFSCKTKRFRKNIAVLKSTFTIQSFCLGTSGERHSWYLTEEE